jgi:hypothetical protein
MKSIKPPLRMMIVTILAGGESLSAAALLARLAPLYPRERQCVETVVEAHLQALKTVGIARLESAAMIDGRLVRSYCITAHGLRRLAWATGVP